MIESATDKSTQHRVLHTTTTSSAYQHMRWDSVHRQLSSNPSHRVWRTRKIDKMLEASDSVCSAIERGATTDARPRSRVLPLGHLQALYRCLTFASPVLSQPWMGTCKGGCVRPACVALLSSPADRSASRIHGRGAARRVCWKQPAAAASIRDGMRGCRARSARGSLRALERGARASIVRSSSRIRRRRRSQRHSRQQIWLRLCMSMMPQHRSSRVRERWRVRRGG